MPFMPVDLTKDNSKMFIFFTMGGTPSTFNGGDDNAVGNILFCDAVVHDQVGRRE